MPHASWRRGGRPPRRRPGRDRSTGPAVRACDVAAEQHHHAARRVPAASRISSQPEAGRGRDGRHDQHVEVQPAADEHRRGRSAPAGAGRSSRGTDSRPTNGTTKLTRTLATNSGSQAPFVRVTKWPTSSGMLPYQISRYWQTQMYVQKIENANSILPEVVQLMLPDDGAQGRPARQRHRRQRDRGDALHERAREDVDREHRARPAGVHRREPVVRREGDRQGEDDDEPRSQPIEALVHAQRRAGHPVLRQRGAAERAHEQAARRRTDRDAREDERRGQVTRLAGDLGRVGERAGAAPAGKAPCADPRTRPAAAASAGTAAART